MFKWSRRKRGKGAVAPNRGRWRVCVCCDFDVSLHILGRVPESWRQCRMDIRNGRKVYGSGVASCREGRVESNVEMSFATTLSLDHTENTFREKVRWFHKCFRVVGESEAVVVVTIIFPPSVGNRWATLHGSPISQLTQSDRASKAPALSP